jgi:hypothetical protein
MPLYTFACECGERVDKLASYDDVVRVCAVCGGAARRVEFYSEQGVQTEKADIPSSEGAYSQEAQKRELKSRGWDIDRTYDAIRKSVVEGPDGNKRVDTTKIATQR